MIGSVPNQDATGCTKPASGWPVVIVMHGLQRNRTDALALSDAYASKCYVVAAIDQALHGRSARCWKTVPGRAQVSGFAKVRGS